MARIAVLTIAYPFELGLSDFVLFHPEVKFDTYGIEGHEGRTFRILRVEGKINLANDLIVIKVNWLKKGSFSFSQTAAFMINVDGKFFWINPSLYIKCMQLNGELIDAKNNIMQCGRGHRWESKKP
ncbi:MAG: hypothetical protein PHF50_04765 [Patescibacteria group bacterium]|nr:hypothetical protein [Patescibacteria group bacterium]